MIGIERAIGHMRLLAAMLVAGAMLLAPLAHAMPVQCHDRAEPAHAEAVEGHHAAVVDDHHDDHDAKVQMVDHGTCCDLACVVWGLAIGNEVWVALQLTYLGHHLLPEDPIFAGLAVPPGLDPPRFSI